MDDLPTPIRHTAHGNLPESCRISSPSPEAMNFVLVMFTWRPMDSSPSFHALTRSTHSSREVAMITRSSAKNSSQGTPTLKSLDKASSTMMKSRGLQTLKHLRFSFTASSTFMSHHQVSLLHWWFFEKPQTSSAALLRMLLRWCQISSDDCVAESTTCPLEHFSSNLASNSAAQAGSRSFQVRSRGVNFRLTRGTAAILKIQTRRRCCVRHSSPGMTSTSRMCLCNPYETRCSQPGSHGHPMHM